MPFLKIHTNQSLDEATTKSVLEGASKITAELLAKPERYVMVDLEAGRQMLFDASVEPLAYLELKSIGLPTGQTTELSAALAEFISTTLSIPKDRIYIEFTETARHMWGWNGKTF
ncbi:MAG: phenylpyruvate tautomerase MIF-related protein [Chromatiales bacterium]|nr:phenylpyruvate tautomerase MIF-related protein [Chromatiales bacterium]